MEGGAGNLSVCRNNDSNLTVYVVADSLLYELFHKVIVS